MNSTDYIILGVLASMVVYSVWYSVLGYFRRNR